MGICLVEQSPNRKAELELTKNLWSKPTISRLQSYSYRQNCILRLNLKTAQGLNVLILDRKNKVFRLRLGTLES